MMVMLVKLVIKIIKAFLSTPNLLELKTNMLLDQFAQQAHSASRGVL